MTTRILYLSRHPMMSEQTNELKQIFGDIRVIRISTVINTADEVVKLMKIHNADELVAVLPLSIIAALTREGIHPIVGVRKKYDKDGNLIPYKRYIHDHYHRVEDVSIRTTQL